MSALTQWEDLLAAGALLTPGKRVPAGQLWAGSPARYVRDLKPGELEEMAYLTRHYVELGEAYLAR